MAKTISSYPTSRKKTRSTRVLLVRWYLNKLDGIIRGLSISKSVTKRESLLSPIHCSHVTFSINPNYQAESLGDKYDHLQYNANQIVNIFGWVQSQRITFGRTRQWPLNLFTLATVNIQLSKFPRAAQPEQTSIFTDDTQFSGGKGVLSIKPNKEMTYGRPLSWGREVGVGGWGEGFGRLGRTIFLLSSTSVGSLEDWWLKARLIKHPLLTFHSHLSCVYN